MRKHFYDQNKDLILIGLSGLIYYAIVIGLNGHLSNVPLAEYFLVPLAVSCFLGMAVQKPLQMIEWPLCFMFGGAIGCITLLSILKSIGMPMNIYQAAFTISSTLAWFGVITTLVLVGILVGVFMKATFNLVMGSLQVGFE